MVKRRRRKNGALFAWVSVGVVVAIVATFVLVKELNSGAERTSFGQTSSAVFNEVTQIPASVFNKVGVSSSAIPVQPVAVLNSQPAYTSHGLPGAFYYGAEFCPYCAATRWGMIAALARFGTFDKLNNMWSSATDAAGPNTPTFTFYGVTYHSTHFHFVGYEVEDRNGKALMSIPSEVNNLVLKYNSQQTFPFMDMGNKVFVRTSAFDPLALQGYKTQASISTLLNNPNNYITQAIVTTANYVSAGLCAISKDPPKSVCTSSGVKAAAHAIGLKLPS